MKAKNKDEHPGLHVIGAYLPEAFSDYIQLIGRTGRQGRKGTALLLIAEYENQGQNIANDTIYISQSDGELHIQQFEENSWKKKK
jgi:superfamily II DNA/RNA helicase